MELLPWPSIAFYCAFGIFVYYQRLYAQAYADDGWTKLLLTGMAFAGMLTGFVYLVYCGWTLACIRDAIQQNSALCPQRYRPGLALRTQCRFGKEIRVPPGLPTMPLPASLSMPRPGIVTQFPAGSLAWRPAFRAGGCKAAVLALFHRQQYERGAMRMNSRLDRRHRSGDPAHGQDLPEAWPGMHMRQRRKRHGRDGGRFTLREPGCAACRPDIQ